MKGIIATVWVLLVVAGTVFVMAYIPMSRETNATSTPELPSGEVLAPPNMEKITAPTLAIMARIDAGPWKKETAVYPLRGQKVALRVKKTAGGTTRWYQIVPDVSKMYKNANFPWDPNPYKWIGLAKIDYSRIELTKFCGHWEILPFSAEASGRPSSEQIERSSLLIRTSANSHYHKDVGSFWFQVEVEKGGRVERSPGIEDSDKKGLPPQVFRVSVRDGEGYLGYLSTFFNVPGVFGSIPDQSSNYIGADCCDALLAAYSVWAGQKIKKDYSVAMLVSQLPKAAECNVLGGKPDRVMRWGQDIQPGNFIAVKYVGAKTYQHIGALHSDADNDGILSSGDLVLHAGPLPLHYSTLSEGRFNGHVVVLDHKLVKLAAY